MNSKGSNDSVFGDSCQRGRKYQPKAKGPQHFSNFGIIFTHLFYDQRRRNYSLGSNDSVFSDSCQRGRKYEPKAKGPHHHLIFFGDFQLVNFKLISYYVLKGEEVVFQKWYIKTLLNTKRWISFRGSFVQSKEKHLKQGETISNLENALQTLIHLPLTICKRSLKWIYKKNLQKQNMWCKCGPKC